MRHFSIFLGFMTHTVPCWRHRGWLQRTPTPCDLGSHPARGDELGPALVWLGAVWQQTRQGITRKPPAPAHGACPRQKNPLCGCWHPMAKSKMWAEAVTDAAGLLLVSSRL